MRRLIEETRGKEVELLDGVKVKHPQGWALVLPDSENLSTGFLVKVIARKLQKN